MKNLMEALQAINLDWSEAVIVGSTALHIYGLLPRAPNDIDIVISQSKWNDLAEHGLVKVSTRSKRRHCYFTNEQGVKLLDFRVLMDTHSLPEHLRDTFTKSILVNGVRCVDPKEMVLWKKMSGRTKDCDDLNNLDRQFTL